MILLAAEACLVEAYAADFKLGDSDTFSGEIVDYKDGMIAVSNDGKVKLIELVGVTNVSIPLINGRYVDGSLQGWSSGVYEVKTAFGNILKILDGKIVGTVVAVGSSAGSTVFSEKQDAQKQAELQRKKAEEQRKKAEEQRKKHLKMMFSSPVYDNRRLIVLLQNVAPDNVKNYKSHDAVDFSLASVDEKDQYERGDVVLPRVDRSEQVKNNIDNYNDVNFAKEFFDERDSVIKNANRLEKIKSGEIQTEELLDSFPKSQKGSSGPGMIVIRETGRFRRDAADLDTVTAFSSSTMPDVVSDSNIESVRKNIDSMIAYAGEEQDQLVATDVFSRGLSFPSQPKMQTSFRKQRRYVKSDDALFDIITNPDHLPSQPGFFEVNGKDASVFVGNTQLDEFKNDTSSVQQTALRPGTQVSVAAIMDANTIDVDNLSIGTRDSELSGGVLAPDVFYLSSFADIDSKDTDSTGVDSNDQLASISFSYGEMQVASRNFESDSRESLYRDSNISVSSIPHDGEHVDAGLTQKAIRGDSESAADILDEKSGVKNRVHQWLSGVISVFQKDKDKENPERVSSSKSNQSEFQAVNAQGYETLLEGEGSALSLSF
jgi:hypothetical protein